MKIHNPFRTALVATLGVGLGILLINSVENLSTVLLYLGTALFLSLGLDPLVSFLERRRLPRWAAVLVTILAVLGVFAGIVLIVLPVLVDQISQLVAQISAIVQRGNLIPDLKEWIQDAFPNAIASSDLETLICLKFGIAFVTLIEREQWRKGGFHFIYYYFKSFSMYSCRKKFLRLLLSTDVKH